MDRKGKEFGLEQRAATIADPLEVRSTTAETVRNLQFIDIDHSGLEAIATTLEQRVKSGQLLAEDQFGTRQITPQRVFIQDAVNFCFWPKKGKPKWQVEFPKGKIHDGWNALTASFERAITEGMPVLEASYLETISEADVKRIFRSCNQTEIPLLGERTAILRETGSLLAKKFSGNIEVLLEAADYDAAAIARAVVANFPSFFDTGLIEGKKVNFFKRAQIFAYDLSLLRNLKITNIESLTAFADYKLPQILRTFGVLHYRKPLASQVDGVELIPKHSREEVEIRAATIQVCERLAGLLEIPAAVVDNALWLLSQETKRKQKPYHSTLTTSY